MPEDATDIPSSFTQIGHIAHMNLRDYYFPWKKLIGQVILDVSRKKDDLWFGQVRLTLCYAFRTFRKTRIFLQWSTSSTVLIQHLDFSRWKFWQVKTT